MLKHTVQPGRGSPNGNPSNQGSEQSRKSRPKPDVKSLVEKQEQYSSFPSHTQSWPTNFILCVWAGILKQDYDLFLPQHPPFSQINKRALKQARLCLFSSPPLPLEEQKGVSPQSCLIPKAESHEHSFLTLGWFLMAFFGLKNSRPIFPYVITEKPTDWWF